MTFEKAALKRFFSFYLNTWWFPPLLAAVIPPAFMFLTAGDRTAAMICCVLMLVLFLGVPLSWGWLLAKGNWRGVLWSFLLSFAFFIPTLLLPLSSLFDI